MGNGAISRESGKLSVRTSIPRTALMALGSALFVVAGGAICAVVLNVLLIETAGMSSLALAVTVLVDSFYLVAGLAAIVFFGFTLLFSLGRLFSFWRPIFEVGPEGILDKASAASVGFVPWEEVKDVRPGTVGGQRFMKVWVKDEQALLQRQNLMKRLVMRLNRRYLTGTIVNVPLTALAIPEEDLLAEIKPHLNPPAQRRLDKLMQSVGSSGPKGGTTHGARNSRITSRHSALRIAGSRSSCSRLSTTRSSPDFWDSGWHSHGTASDRGKRPSWRIR